VGARRLTAAGTVALTDFVGNPFVREIVPFGAEDVFFTADGYPHGEELWRGSVVEVPDPPETQLTQAKIKRRRGKATFAFAGQPDAGVAGDITFECKLKAGWTACTPPKTYRRLRTGRYTFRVRSVDAEERKDESPARRAFRIKRR
jgi:hypothetical protein